ncbi:FAD-dependent oxidoreductase [Luteococcus japonicus]|uniref:CoA-disulfide reductase / Disulfide bond regulator n=1 Tax=Luteococcus japonicus LSP_Lj1 TaxID=1255658 RepID=A0A1R4I6L3_9ACTN|nr:FAD-dependent oxidoreductase [Luteococcus japonicus]SJN15477.1 CoA-disulfide reductase / Disulfide bond regulator [Luteococcus japonicus LSP_Lj1]
MKLVVVGGVAAGMSLAARVRRLDEDAEILVLERGHHVSFANCGLPYHVGEVIKDRDRLVLQTPQSLAQSLNLDVRLRHEVIDVDAGSRNVTVRDLDSGREFIEHYDELALCMGASAIIPPIPGVDLPGIHVLRSLSDMDQIKQRADKALTSPHGLRALVVGAGFIGLEAAENLRERGADVHVVEMAPQILPPVDREIAADAERTMRSHGIKLHLGTAATAFDADGPAITATLDDGSRITADLVVLAIGVRPLTELAVAAGVELGARGGVKVDNHQRTTIEHIWAAGDVVESPHTVLPGHHLVPLAGPANRQGRVAAENICGRETSYDSTQGTSVVKLFTMTVAATGANSRQLQAAGIDFSMVHVHPTGHAGYYPGTSPMHLKVLFSPDDGRLLGAQCAGFDGVEKRIDVIATALRMGGSVFDLEKLELSYAPPYGSAKDPVNMAGFLASNTILGDARLWYPGDSLEGCRVIDVREPTEFDVWHLDGSENVPLGTLREALTDWDREQPVRLLCAVGFRSYLAHRILVQRGFTDIAFLSGGSATYRAWTGDQPDVVDLSAIISQEPLIAPFTAAPTETQTVDLDCTGLACPGPIMRLSETMKGLRPGDEIVATVSDMGFAADGPAWARRNGHELVSLEQSGAGVRAVFRHSGAVVAQAAAASAAPAPSAKAKNSFVVFSGDMDKMIAAFIIANGALALGNDVSMFFTFWGLNALRDPKAPKRDMKPMDKMFKAMMPSGADALTLSQMNMGGAGTAMIKNVMKQHNVPSVPELIQSAIDGGARLIACTMTMDLLGIDKSDLLPGVDFGGVATFLDEAGDSQTTLFI